MTRAATFTNAEVEERIGRALELARAEWAKDFNRLQEMYKQAEFRAAVAEWAVAGLMARDLRLSFQIGNAALEQKLNNVFDMAGAMGKQAGREFLNRAELAFKDHAQLSELRLRLNREHNWHTVMPADAFDVSKVCWPRPY